VALKIFMAATGILLVLFLFAHMAGNLKIFFGPGTFDHYAHWLRTIGSPLLPDLWYLWIQRTVLTVAVLGHIAAATILARRARKARPVRYAHRPKVQGSYAARTMRWGGVIILLFVIYHLMHFTFGNVHPSFIEGDVGHNFIEGFKNVWVSLFYILAMIFLGLHLRHGIWSACQTLGVSHPSYIRIAKAAAWVFAALIVIGNVSFPVAVLAGWVK
jgi:succinate dehydrogenase / fumarate reductase, cytochrome b subunit